MLLVGIKIPIKRLISPGRSKERFRKEDLYDKGKFQKYKETRRTNKANNRY